MGPSFFRRAARLVIMGSMKRLALLFSCSAALVCATDLASVHTVYLLKMSRGLDQFLASRLTDRPRLPGRDRPETGRRRVHGPDRRGFRDETGEIVPHAGDRQAGAAAEAGEDRRRDQPAARRYREQAVESGSEFVVRTRQGHRLSGGRQVAAGDLVDVRACQRVGLRKIWIARPTTL